MRIGDRGWLVADASGARVVALPTVRTSPLVVKAPVGLVWHTTGGMGGPRWAEALARSIQGYRRGVDRPASWHFLVGKDGTVFQSAPVTVGTWHVGRPGKVGGQNFKNINHATIGVELENAGPLINRKDEFYAWPYWQKGDRTQPDPRLRVARDRVAFHNKASFDGFTEAQAASATELASCLKKAFGWDSPALRHAHADFASPVKTDPGPLWMDEFLPALIARIERSETQASGANT